MEHSKSAFSYLDVRVKNAIESNKNNFVIVPRKRLMQGYHRPWVAEANRDRICMGFGCFGACLYFPIVGLVARFSDPMD